MMTDDAERERFEAWANERELDLTPGYPGQYSDCNTDFAWGAWKARAALSSRADRPEPATGAVYGGKGEAALQRLTEEQERLGLYDDAPRAEAVALWAAFAPEGNLLAHSKLRPGLSDILNWEPLYRTASQADGGKGEAVCDRIVCWHNRRCVNDDAATMRNCPHRATTPQAECAPREAQPVADTVRECLSDVVSHYRALYAGLAFQLNEATNTENSDDMAYWKHEIKALERMYVQAESALAAPTPERADAGKDAERYRWLREQDDSGPLFVMYGSNGRWGECGHSDIYGELLDKSIDEEIAKEAKK